ncbi:hypothetical protein [Pseudomonas sp.]|uniref:hypothetical protein n=1 Tax=Pseudomonas sp. TaxID=306 RepID=UPI0035669D4D
MRISFLLPVLLALTLMGCDDEPAQPSAPVPPPPMEQDAPMPAEPMPAEPMPSEPMPAEPAPAEPAEDDYQQ